MYLTVDFPDGAVVKNLLADTGDVDLISGLGKSPGEGNGNPFHSCRENSMVRGAWQATAHGLTKSQIQLFLYCILNDQAFESMVI